MDWYYQKKKIVRVIIKCPKNYCDGAYNNVTGVIMERGRSWSEIRVDEKFWKAVEDSGHIRYPSILNKYIFPLFQNFILENE